MATRKKIGKACKDIYAIQESNPPATTLCHFLVHGVIPAATLCHHSVPFLDAWRHFCRSALRQKLLAHHHYSCMLAPLPHCRRRRRHEMRQRQRGWQVCQAACFLSRSSIAHNLSLVSIAPPRQGTKVLLAGVVSFPSSLRRAISRHHTLWPTIDAADQLQAQPPATPGCYNPRQPHGPPGPAQPPGRSLSTPRARSLLRPVPA